MQLRSYARDADIADIADTLASTMESLDLTNSSKVVGNLDSLHVATKIKNIKLAGTQVRGNVGALTVRVGPTLLCLDLSHLDRVTGDIVTIATNCPALVELLLRGCKKIAGSFDDLPILPKLRRLDLAGTRVGGSVEQLGNKTPALEVRGLVSVGKVSAHKSPCIPTLSGPAPHWMRWRVWRH